MRTSEILDGCSTDRTVDLALGAGARVVSDEGRGLPWARTLGVRSSSTRWVLLVDADVVFGPTGVAELVAELAEGQPRWLPYYVAFCWYNYVGLARGVSS